MFKVGQRVVCVKTHTCGVVRRGQEFVVSAIEYCRVCGIQAVDVGATHRYGRSECDCGNVGQMVGCVWWIASELFAPIEEISETTYEDIMETVPVKLSEGL